jgi:hypothetical protein
MICWNQRGNAVSKRNYIDEILDRKQRLVKGASREDQFTRRVHPLVKGFRVIKSLNKSVDYRNEWLKYGIIGYVACIEGYFRVLITDLIDADLLRSENIANFKELKLGVDSVIAIHSKKVTLGEFVSHILPLNNFQDIAKNLSVILDLDFIKYLKEQPCSEWNPKPFGEVFPEFFSEIEELFRLRHVYAHELAPRQRVSPRQIERCIGAGALFVTKTEEYLSRDFLTIPTVKRNVIRNQKGKA